jgi:hypothetical protein
MHESEYSFPPKDSYLGNGSLVIGATRADG